MHFSESGSFRKSTVWAALAVLLCVPGILFFSLKKETDDSLFTAEYPKTYSQLQKYEQKVFLPGSGSNKIRQNLNASLEKTLVGEISPAERVRTAKEGLDQLALLREQINAARQGQKDLKSSTQELAKTVAFVSRRRGEEAENILLLFEKYEEQGNGAISLLEKMNNDVEQIFSRTIKEGGILPESFITELNEQIPEAEKTANDLFGLYADMVKTKKNIENETITFFSKGS